MQNTMSILLIAAATLTLLLSSLNALDLESAKETKCIDVKKTASMDLGWVMSVKKWYYPVMSRLDIYLTATEMSDKKSAKDITEDELYYDSCMTFGIEGGSFVGYGFNGIKKTFNVKPIKGMEVYEAFNYDGSKFGTCYTTLTDNKTFIFTTCCTDLGQMSWGLITTMKNPPEETIKLALEHAKSLGFKKEFFTGFRYDHCKLDEDDGKESKTEL